MQNNKTTMGKPKRLIALLLCLVMAVMALPSQVFAATGDVGTISFTLTYDANGNAMHYNSSAVINGYTAGGAGNYKYRMYVDGDTAFCIQPGVPLHTGDTLKESSSATWNALSANQKKAVGLALLYGYQGNKSNLTGGDDEKWLATQTLVWEFVTGRRNATGSYTQTGTDVYQLHFGSNYANSGAKAAYDQIVAMLKEHNTIPSFMSESKTGITKELSYSGGKYTITLTDSNGVLSDYTFSCSDSNVSITKSGNKLTINSTNAIDGSARITATRNNVPTVSTSAKLLAYGDANLQDVVTGVENADSVNAYINIETPTGTLALKKTSEDGVVSGIKFTITGNNFEKTVTTGSDGTISAPGMFPGTYTVTEASYDRYVEQKSQTVTVIGGQTSTVSFSNVLKKFRVTVTKTDAKTGVAQGDASFAGAVYGIYHNGDLVDSYTTDANGQFTTRYYICGTGWTIKEISPSEGYLLDPTVYTVGADPKLYTIELNTTKNSVLETVTMGKIRLIKHIDKWDEDIDPDEQDPGGNTGIIEQPEAGAKFQIYLKSAGSYENAKDTERDILVTDSDGMALSKDLPYGRYVVHQIEGMEGQSFAPDFTVFIRENEQTYSYILNNDSITGRVRIEKHDAETGKIIPLSGVGFKVRDMSTGEFISQTVYYPNPVTHEVYYTSDEGWLMLPDELSYGDYELVEVETAYGYVLDSTPVPFKIDGEDAVVVVVKKNMPQKGKILISKTGEVFYSVSETEGVYQPIYEVTGLAGATYDIIADEDIITGDGTLRAAKGDVVDTVTTTENGAESKLLYLGRYRIVERQAPEGMVLNGEEFLVELTYAGQEVEVTSTDLSVYNERQKVAIDLLKSVETDKLFGIGQSEEYQAISFGLYAEKELVAADGNIIPADGLIEVVSLDPESIGVDEETGALRLAAKFASDLPFGSFYLQEQTTDGHYKIIDTKFPVLFEYQGQDTAIVSISANDGKPIENDLIRGRVAGLKVDEDGEGLADAVIGIFRPDTEKFTEENALVVTKSAEDGSFSFEDIPFGHWIVREIAPPEAFVLNDELHHVYVGMDEQVIEIRIENTLIRGTVQLVKVDSEYPDKRLSGAIFEVYQDVNGDKKFDKDDVLIGVMDEPDKGLHEMRGLVYGNYFVIEKQSPENFKPDTNPYYFEIRVDGEVVRVTNSDKDGFVNEAMKGSLKIIKTSSDGKKEGFTFKVESKELGYSETFVTDKNGEIFIENLRVGKYTVSEVKTDATEGYKLPDPVEIEIIADQTLEVRVHNDKVTVDVPKTGDDTNLIFWLTLLGAGLAGCVTAAVLAMKKKKKPAVPETEPPATE